MVRHYQRKKENPPPEEAVLKSAVQQVIENKMSLRGASLFYGVAKSTLGTYVKSVKNNGGVIPNVLKKLDHSRVIIPINLEVELVTYLTTCSLMAHGLTPLQTRELAYNFAIANSIAVPNSWNSKKQAGKDWFSSFLKRNPTLSIRAPEATSQGRASVFNPVVVKSFFDNLLEVSVKFKFPVQRIWNTDETGIPTVLKPPKVLAKKGLKQVNQTVSNERGVNTTMLAFICAGGTQIPPIYIFPRKKFRPEMTRRGPNGCKGLAHPSGWINGDLFLEGLQHFVEFTGCAPGKEHLLLLDNHSSHLDVRVIDFAKENGIVLLTFPPHCSHRLQPLDVSVFGPFKSALKASFNEWLQLNPGRRISIHEIAELSNIPYLKAFSPSNIVAGFQKAGIYPFNRDIFSEQDFLASFATDRPEPTEEEPPAQIPAQIPAQVQADIPVTTILHSISVAKSPVATMPSTPVPPPRERTSSSPLFQTPSPSVLPSQIRPFPRVSPEANSTRKKRQPGKTQILTKSPPKKRVEPEVTLSNQPPAKKTRKKRTEPEVLNSEKENQPPEKKTRCGRAVRKPKKD